MNLETKKYLIDYSEEESSGINVKNKNTGIIIGVKVCDNERDVIIDVKDSTGNYISYQELAFRK